MASGYLSHDIIKEHWEGKKRWINCWQCWLMYSALISFQALLFWGLRATKVKYNLLNIMGEVIIFISVIIGISIPPIIAVWLDHYFNKKKKEAETKKIQLQNKITEEITYEQLKTEGKQKDIKGKIDIFQRLLELEEKIKNKKEKTVEDEKKLESLEMIRKEFRERSWFRKNRVGREEFRNREESW